MTAAAVSVVVPMRNERLTAARLIEELDHQATPAHEIVVVDAGSTDDTVAVVKSVPTRTLVRTIEIGPAYPGTARNAGVAAADGQWIAFIDAGCVPDRQWLAELVHRAQSEPAVEVVYGTYDPALDDLFAECAALAYVGPTTVREGVRTRAPSIVSSLVRRDLVLAAGGFPDHRSAEDLIFMNEIERCGAAIGYADARVTWTAASSLGATYRRFRLYSEHNLRAGLGGSWHTGVLRQYAGVAAALVLALLVSPYFALLVPCWLVTRVVRSCWRKRFSFQMEHPLSPHRWPLIAGILLTVDLATLMGALAYLRARRA